MRSLVKFPTWLFMSKMVMMRDRLGLFHVYSYHRPAACNEFVGVHCSWSTSQVNQLMWKSVQGECLRTAELKEHRHLRMTSDTAADVTVKFSQINKTCKYLSCTQNWRTTSLVYCGNDMTAELLLCIMQDDSSRGIVPAASHS